MLEMMRQLCTVGQLHRNLLPREIPQRDGWHVAVHYSAGIWPGGDYYDVLRLPNGNLFFLIGDASDQGPASTALALMIRVVLHSRPLSSGVARVPLCPFSAPSSHPPHILLEHLSRVLAENKLAEQFMTAFCGILDPDTGRCQFANAGHPFPRWWRASTGFVEPLCDADGPPLGADYHAKYAPQSMVLDPGDLLILYSDSLTALASGRRRSSVQEFLDEPLRETASEGAEAVKAALLDRLEDHLAGQAYPDEITFIIIERKTERQVRKTMCAGRG